MYLGKFLIFAALCLASTASVAEPSGCSYNDLVETYKRDPAAFRALVTACEGADEGTSKSKSGSISSAQCPEDEQLKNLRRSASSYAKDIDELEDEKRRLDKELERFDKAFAKADAAQSDPFTRFIGMASRQGKEGISAAGTESLSQDANIRSERDNYQKERFALQNQILQSKMLINEQIRSYQRDLDNSEFQIKTIMSERREQGC